MENTPVRKSKIDKLKDLTQFISVITVIAGAVLTYYNFFIDPSRIPALRINCKMEKVTSDNSVYVVKMIVDMENRSKKKVIFGDCFLELYGVKSNCSPSDNGQFFENISSYKSSTEDPNIGLARFNRFMTDEKKELIAYVPLQVKDSSWAFSDDQKHLELVSVVPKYFNWAQLRVIYGYGEIATYSFADIWLEDSTEKKQ